MKKIIFFSMIILSTIVGSDDSSKLDDFEESLTKEKTTTNNDSNSSNSKKKSCYYHSYYKSNCDNCNNRKGSFFVRLFGNIFDSFFDSFFDSIFDSIFNSSGFDNKSELSKDTTNIPKITFDKYPFYSSRSMIKGIYSSNDIGKHHMYRSNNLLEDSICVINTPSTKGSKDLVKSSFFHTQIGKYYLNNSIYGDMFLLNYQRQKHVFTFSNKILKEKYGSDIIRKNIHYLTYSYIISDIKDINNNTSWDGINVALGIGISDWNSNTYKDSGIRLKSSFNSFVKPFSFDLITGYSFIGNGIFDLEARASYHYKRLSLSVGHQRLKVPSGSLIKGTAYSLGFWF